MGKYNDKSEGDIAHFLRSFGNTPINRTLASKKIHIPRRGLGLLGFTQPSHMVAMVNQDQDASGWVARFIVIASKVVARKYEEVGGVPDDNAIRRALDRGALDEETKRKRWIIEYIN